VTKKCFTRIYRSSATPHSRNGRILPSTVCARAATMMVQRSAGSSESNLLSDDDDDDDDDDATDDDDDSFESTFLSLAGALQTFKLLKTRPRPSQNLASHASDLRRPFHILGWTQSTSESKPIQTIDYMNRVHYAPHTVTE
jgi:hypothetical protein